MEQTIETPTDTAMKVTMQRKELSDALALPAMVSPQRAVSALYSSILIQATDDAIRFVGCDDRMWAQSSTQTSVEREGSACVQARLLSEIVSSLSDAPIEISSADTVVHVDSGSSHYEIPSINWQDFPEIPDEGGETEISLLSGEFRQAIASVEYAAAGDLSRPILGGIQVTYDGKDLAFVATDTHRLAVTRFAREGLGSAVSVVLPSKAMSTIKQLPLQDDEQIKIRLDDNHVYVAAGTSRIVSQILQENYPNWQRVVPAETTRSWQFDRTELLENVRRIMILARDNANRIRLAGDGYVVTLNAESPEKGKGSEQATCVSNNGDIEIAFNGRYVLDALNAMESDSVTFEMTDPARPAVLKPGDAANESFCVIMPMSMG